MHSWSCSDTAVVLTRSLTGENWFDSLEWRRIRRQHRQKKVAVVSMILYTGRSRIPLFLFLHNN